MIDNQSLNIKARKDLKNGSILELVLAHVRFKHFKISTFSMKKFIDFLTHFEQCITKLFDNLWHFFYTAFKNVLQFLSMF